jgi:hypothetical protein
VRGGRLCVRGGPGLVVLNVDNKAFAQQQQKKK